MLQKSRLCMLGAFVAAAFTAAGRTADAQPRVETEAQSLQRVLGGAPYNYLIQLSPGTENSTADVPQSEYWIGISLGEMLEIVQKQLGLEHGVVISEVMPDSPAARSEIKQHDILLEADGKALHAPADVVRAVDAAKEKPLELLIFRAGKERKITVTPTKRPAPQVALAAPAGDFQEEIKRLEEALASLKSRAGFQSVWLSQMGPGVVADPAAIDLVMVKQDPFPKNLTVRITREGDKPIRIFVKRDEGEWELSADEIDKLPEDIRVHVQPMLGGGSPVRWTTTNMNTFAPVRVNPAVPRPRDPNVPRSTGPAATSRVPATAAPAPARAYYRPGGSASLEEKVDAISRKLDQMKSQSIEDLQSEVRQLRKELDALREPKEKRE